MGITLTDRKLKSLKPAKPGQRYDVMDTVRGFGVRVTDKGQRTFILIARYPGSTNPTRRALGEYPTLSLEKAREKARAWHKLLAEGIDPRVEQLRIKEDEKRKAQEAVAAVENRFEDAREGVPAPPLQRSPASEGGRPYDRQGVDAPLARPADR